MKLRNTTILLTALALTTFTACSTGTMNMQSAIDQTNGGVLTRNTISEIDAGSVAHTINDGEIALAQIAVSNASSSEVRAFAQMMITEHQSANSMLESKGFRATENAVTRLLNRDVDTRSAALRALSGADFDREYVASQVDMHQKALQLINGTLVPSAYAEGLRQTLSTMRTSVQSHLEQARTLQSSVGTRS